MYYFHFSDQIHVAEDKWSNLKNNDEKNTRKEWIHKKLSASAEQW